MTPPMTDEQLTAFAKEWKVWTDYLAMKPSMRRKLPESEVPVLSPDFDDITEHQAVNILAADNLHLRSRLAAAERERNEARESALASRARHRTAATTVKRLTIERDKAERHAAEFLANADKVTTERDEARAKLTAEEALKMDWYHRAKDAESKLKESDLRVVGYRGELNTRDRQLADLTAKLARAEEEAVAARGAVDYLRRGVDGYDETFDVAYEQAGARGAHGEWYWPTNTWRDEKVGQ